MSDFNAFFTALWTGLLFAKFAKINIKRIEITTLKDLELFKHED